VRIKIIPGITPTGGRWFIHQIAKMELTGTSKKTISETTAGETRLRTELNIVWPRNCAPKIRPSKIHHSRALKCRISFPAMIAIGSAVIAQKK
jgi:hypothetical protein